jgi:CheY-like chemotaxis protein
VPSFEDRDRRLAYKIWEREGQPQGRALHHWHLACDVVRTEDFEERTAAADRSREAWDYGRGSASPISLALPRRSGHAAAAGAPEVLVVIADFAEKERVSSVLRGHGLLIHEASSALCAFEQLVGHNEIEVVVVDCRAGDRDTLCRYIKSTRPRVEIISLPFAPAVLDERHRINRSGSSCDVNGVAQLLSASVRSS